MYRRLGFCGKSDRENASPTESAFEMSSKFREHFEGNTNLILKEDLLLQINAGGTAGIF